MAYSTTSPTRALPAPAPVSNFFHRIARAFETNQEQARIVRELSLMSTRELADLGLSPSDIPDVARGAYRRD